MLPRCRFFSYICTMKIIHLVSNKVWGGGERYALDLCKALRAEGHDVAVWCRKGTAPAEVFASEGLLAGTLPLAGMLDVVSAIRLSSVLRGTEGGVTIHVHNFKDASTAVLARRMSGTADRVRIVATRHLVKPARTDRSHLITLNALDRIVFVSQLALDEFMTTKPALHNGLTTVIHNAVNLPACPHTPHTDPVVRVLFAGRVVPEKGLHTLIDALVRVKDLPWSLRICGTGDPEYMAGLRQQARTLGLERRIDWEGHVADMSSAYENADIMVVPSEGRESFGLVVLEAWARSLPVVSTDNGAQREIITDGTDGLLVPPANPDAMGKALRRLISDRQLRQQMGDAGRQAFETRFSWDRFMRRMKAVYRI